MNKDFEKLQDIVHKIGICALASVTGWLLGLLIGYVVKELLK